MPPPAPAVTTSFGRQDHEAPRFIPGGCARAVCPPGRAVGGKRAVVEFGLRSMTLAPLERAARPLDQVRGALARIPYLALAEGFASYSVGLLLS
jgi:hypothetical protein